MGIKISMQREVKERIRKEIIEAAQQYAEEYEYEIENYTDTASALNCVYAEFKDQFDWKIKQIGEYNAFIEWLKGLPMFFVYSYDDERMRIQKWFNQSNEEASKYSDAQVDKLYWNLLAREFFALVKKFNVSGIIKSEDDTKVTPYDMDDYLDNDNVLEESNMINSKKNILKMSDVDFQELYNEINKEIKNIDKKYIVKYMNKDNKNKISDSNGLKIFKLLPDGLKLRLYNKWKKYLSVDEINFALDKVAEKILNIDDEDINNVLEESNIIDNNKRNPKIIKENPDGSGQVEYTRYTSHYPIYFDINEKQELKEIESNNGRTSTYSLVENNRELYRATIDWSKSVIKIELFENNPKTLVLTGDEADDLINAFYDIMEEKEYMMAEAIADVFHSKGYFK